ncbi:hypothetical protein ACFW6K_33045 [Streptomyces sp. NPDC058733]|uniref:hypothetical protein n=1 Tax=Streptomyces sp. NPDC058733 TaxID=3346614 RepID=UPI0036C969F8
MRPRNGCLTVAFITSVIALTGGCAKHDGQHGTDTGAETPSAAPRPSPTATPTWHGKEDQEKAMRNATRALNATESEGAQRVDEGVNSLSQGLNKTFTAKDRPHTFDIACQAPGPRSITLTLTRGTAQSEWDVTCGDREADQFNIPAGSTFTAHVPAAGTAIDGLVLWRFNAVDSANVDGCDDEIKGCED